MQVRQRSTTKGRKGTIIGKWKSEKRGKRLTYRCKLPIRGRLLKYCGYKRAGSHCLEVEGDRCPRLVTSYQ